MLYASFQDENWVFMQAQYWFVVGRTVTREEYRIRLGNKTIQKSTLIDNDSFQACFFKYCETQDKVRAMDIKMMLLWVDEQLKIILSKLNQSWETLEYDCKNDAQEIKLTWTNDLIPNRLIGKRSSLCPSMDRHI